jgi:hypothetical protein
MTPIPCVVHALAEVVVPDPPLRACEVEGRPVPVGEGGPYPVVAVERDRPLDSHGPSGLADVLNLALERELGRWTPMTTSPRSRYLSAYARTKASVRSELMLQHVIKHSWRTISRQVGDNDVDYFVEHVVAVTG